MSTITLTKYCSRGRHTVPRSQFNKNAVKSSGLSTWCKACTRDYSQRLDREPRNPLEQLRKQLGIRADGKNQPAITKECARCHQTKPRTKEFFYYRVRKSSWRKVCIACTRAERRAKA